MKMEEQGMSSGRTLVFISFGPDDFEAVDIVGEDIDFLDKLTTCDEANESLASQG